MEQLILGSGKGRETRRKGKMREALDNVDGQDDVIRRTSGLFLGDDYKEVKDHVVFFVWLNRVLTPS